MLIFKRLTAVILFNLIWCVIVFEPLMTLLMARLTNPWELVGSLLALVLVSYTVMVYADDWIDEKLDPCE